MAQTKKATKKLTPKQAQFVKEFLVDLNGTAAARRAGYSAKTAEQQGYQLLQKTSVKKAVAKAMQARSERTEITADQVLKELALIGFSDMRDFASWGPDGVKLEESSELTEDQARAVAEVNETKTEHGGTVRFKLHDKRASLVDIGRHLGMFTDNVNLSGGLTLTHEQALEQLK